MAYYFQFSQEEAEVMKSKELIFPGHFYQLSYEPLQSGLKVHVVSFHSLLPNILLDQKAVSQPQIIKLYIYIFCPVLISSILNYLQFLKDFIFSTITLVCLSLSFYTENLFLFHNLLSFKSPCQDSLPQQSELSVPMKCSGDKLSTLVL